MLLDILKYPDPRLNQRSALVEVIDGDIKVLIDNMFDTLYADDNNCGLAAPQVGHHKRVVVIDASENKSEPLCLINPKIIKSSGTQKNQEACLSIPGAYEEVTRAAMVEFTAMDADGKTISMEATGLLAQCVQHELDHLEGMLFLEKLSGIRRRRALDRMRKYNNSHHN